MGDNNNPYDSNSQQPDNAGQPQYQQPNNQQPDSTGQPQYQQPNNQQPDTTGQPQYQQPNYQQPSQQQFQQPNYQQPQYQQPNYNQYQQPTPKKTNAFSLTSLICGGVSFFLGCCFWYVMWIPSILGIIFGIMSISNNKKNGVVSKGDKIMSIIGIILASIALLFIIICAIFSIFFSDSITDWANTYYNSNY
jgi:hypothetical protein